MQRTVIQAYCQPPLRMTTWFRFDAVERVGRVRGGRVMLILLIGAATVPRSE